MVLVIIFSSFMILPAKALKEEKVIFDVEMIEDMNFSPSRNVDDVLVEGENIYVLFQHAIYCYTLGEEEPQKLHEIISDNYKEELFFENYEEAKGEIGSKADDLIHYLFFWNQNLYGVNKFTQIAMAIDPEKGNRKPERDIQFKNWEILQEDNVSVSNRVEGVLKNQLYIKSIDYSKSEKPFYSPQVDIVAFDLITGEGIVQNISNVQRLIPYNNNSFVAVLYDEYNAYDEETQELIPPKVVQYFPEKDEIDEIMPLKEYQIGGIAVSAESGKVYYSSHGEIYQKDKEDGKEEVIGYVQNPYESFSQKAWVVNEEKYILWKGWNDGIVITPIGETYGKSEALYIWGSNEDQINQGFSKKHPEISLALTGDLGEETYTTEGLIEKLKEKKIKADVLIIPFAMYDMEMLIQSGVVYPITENEVIKNNVTSMYPYIKEYLGFDGQVAFIPKRVWINTLFSYNPYNWESYGFSKEEVPKTWMEFLDFLVFWQENIRSENPREALLGGQVFTKTFLISLVMEEYVNYYQKNQLPFSFNTPLFRELMEKVAKVNLPIQDEGNSIYDEYDHERSPFETYGANIVKNDTDGIPLLLALDEEHLPTLKVTFSVMFVNAYSEKIDLAIDYVEETMNQYKSEEKIYLYENENTPIKNVDYLTTQEEFEQRIIKLEKDLAEAEDSDEIGRIEHALTYFEKEKGKTDKYYWEISPKEIELYQEFLPNIYIPQTHYVHNWETIQKMMDVRVKFLEEKITLEEFISNLEKLIGNVG